MSKRRIQRKRLRIAVVLTISLLLLLPINALAVTGVDWGKEASYAGDGNGIGSWSIVAGDGGYYIHLVGQYWLGGTLSLDNGKQIIYNDGLHSGSNWNESPGSVVSKQGNQVEFFIPEDYFAGASTISVGNTNLAIANIPSISGGGTEPSPEPEPLPEPEPTPEPTEPTVPADYNGIVINGNFDDWAAVTKTDVNENKNWNTVDHVALVWDGDYIYLYFDAMGTEKDWGSEGNWDSVCGGGPHNNGQYAITTDLGNQLLVQLKNDNGRPAVSGIDGAIAAVNNTAWDKAPHYWEVRIPASALPKYKDTISFGFYQVAPLIKDVANLQGGDSGGTFNGVVIDGNYEDWEYYPHTTIQYATSGTQESVVDSRGALWNDGGKLYAHAETTMPAHLQEAGGEFTQAVTIKINDSTDLEFAPRFIAVDADGNINWDPPRSGLADGEYEYYMVSLDAPGTSKNINDLIPGDEIYGRMKVTVGETMDSCEWEMDVEKLAKHLRPNVEGTVITEIDPSNIKTISVQWGRLGQEWVTTAGTSTGPLLGIMLCLGVCAVPAALISRKRRGQP